MATTALAGRIELTDGSDDHKCLMIALAFSKAK
jgi:hypothetical protein